MNGIISGGYVFTSKSNKTLVNLSVEEERLNAVGKCYTNIMTLQDNLPVPIADMVGKKYVIDVRYGNNGSGFATSFYLVK